MGEVNITGRRGIETESEGVWQGDNPLDFAFPLLIVQTILILFVTRCLTLLLKPLRQPKVTAEILGGILLGPSATGRSKVYLNRIFPAWSTPILESVASIGLLFFLFLVGLELDLSSIRRGGRRAFSIALAGISVTFLGSIGVTFVLRKTVDGVDKVGYAQFVVFMGVSLSITALPVLARILAELKLLTTQVGETAMAAAAFNDVAAWILLALAVALTGGGGGGGNPWVSLWVLLSGAGFVAVMMVAIRPAMKRVIGGWSPEQKAAEEAYICVTLVGVLISGLVTDLIGIHSIFGGFVFGLTIPKGGRFAERLTERIEGLVSGLLLPLYFASSGLKTDIGKISGGKAWGLLALLISTACAGKILVTFLVSMAFLMPFRDSLALGLLMNTKGLVELIVLNIGKDKKVLNDEVFALSVLMALFTTFMTTPSVMAVYKPATDGDSSGSHRQLSERKVESELRILACLHGSENIPSLKTLIESTRSNKNSSLKLFTMRLVELTERSSSIMMVQRARKNGFPFFTRFRKPGESLQQDPIIGLGSTFNQPMPNSHLGRVEVRPTTTISSLSTMHEDICHVAKRKRVSLIVLPFHKYWRSGGGCSGGGGEEENIGRGWRVVNRRVLEHAPCSVAVLVDYGFGPNGAQRICLVFFGGPDDREALQLARRMVEHPEVELTVVRFHLAPVETMEVKHVILQPMPSESYTDKELDDIAIAEFKSKWDDGSGRVEYMDKEAGDDIVEAVSAIGQEGGYDLMMVGKGRFPSSIVAKLTDRHRAHHTELGPIGDILVGSDGGTLVPSSSSILVIQQHQTSRKIAQ